MNPETNSFKTQNKISPLFHIQRKTGAEFSEVNGWWLPIQYRSTEQERQALQTAAVVLDLSPQGKIVLRGKELDPFLEQLVGQSPHHIGRVVLAHPPQLDGISSITMARLTNDEIMLFTAPGEESSLVPILQERVDVQHGISWVDQTAGYAGFLLAGPRARDILRKRTSLPLEEASFPDLSAAQTGFAKTRALLLRHDLASVPGFEIYIDRSLGEYVWKTILDAGRTWEMQPAGWDLYTDLRSKM